MVDKWKQPLVDKGIGALDCKRYLVQYGIAQQHARAPLFHAISLTSSDPMDINSDNSCRYHHHPAPAVMRQKRRTQCMVRSMGFAAIAYGDLILKFLEFVPKYGIQGKCALYASF